MPGTEKNGTGFLSLQKKTTVSGILPFRRKQAYLHSHCEPCTTVPSFTITNSTVLPLLVVCQRSADVFFLGLRLGSPFQSLDSKIPVHKKGNKCWQIDCTREAAMLSRKKREKKSTACMACYTAHRREERGKEILARARSMTNTRTISVLRQSNFSSLSFYF